MIMWVTGNCGAGKTTLAKEIRSIYGGILLDGDEMRNVWTLGFTKEDRYEQNLRIARLARMLEHQGYDVIVSTICPYRALRMMVKQITSCEFIELLGGKESTENSPYEPEEKKL